MLQRTDMSVQPEQYLEAAHGTEQDIWGYPQESQRFWPGQLLSGHTRSRHLLVKSATPCMNTAGEILKPPKLSFDTFLSPTCVMEHC